MKEFVVIFGAAALVLCPFHSAKGQFYGDPPDEHHPWAIHDSNRPQPPRVEPGNFSTQEKPGVPPSDAVVLFDGTEESLLENWEADKKDEKGLKPTWVVKNGTLQCVPKSGWVRTKEEWGDCQLHVEWSAPLPVEGNSQGRGNSGVFLMGKVEIQVLDNYDNPTYSDGFAGSLYGQNPPMANALNKPGEWNSYDIVFRKPVYDGDNLVEPGTITVFLNGVLVQQNTTIEGPTFHRKRTKAEAFPEKGPLLLQDHNNPVRYRNIWYRPLPKRVAEGGDGSYLGKEETKAKRIEIAAEIRQNASELSGMEQTLRLAESLVYEPNNEVFSQVVKQTNDYLESLQNASEKEVKKQKGNILKLEQAMSYLKNHTLIAEPMPAHKGIIEIMEKQDWKKK